MFERPPRPPIDWDDLAPRLADWCRAHDVPLCVLFGSQATGRAHGRSDVDLALWPAERPSPRQHLDWIGELEDLCRRDVSMVLVSPDTNPTLGYQIVKDGRVLYEAVPGEWMKRWMQLWHAYNDALPFRRLERELLRQFVEEIDRGS